MNTLFNVCTVLFLSGVLQICAADGPIDQSALAKKLIAPRIVFRIAKAEEALEFIKRKSQELDPDKKGVNLVFTKLPESATQTTFKPTFDPATSDLNDPSNYENAVTFDVTNISVFDAVQRIAKAASLEVTARSDAIVIHEKGSKP